MATVTNLSLGFSALFSAIALPYVIGKLIDARGVGYIGVAYKLRILVYVLAVLSLVISVAVFRAQERWKLRRAAAVLVVANSLVLLGWAWIHYWSWVAQHDSPKWKL